MASASHQAAVRVAAAIWARITELDAAIAVREADGDEDHPDLTGARDWYRPVSFADLAYAAGWDFHALPDEQSSHAVAWREAYEAEAARPRNLSLNIEQKKVA